MVGRTVESRTPRTPHERRERRERIHGRPGPRGRRLVGGAVLTGLVAWLLVVPAASAQEAPAFSGPAAIPASPDFATERFSNPWDYSDLDDIILNGPGPMDNLLNQRLDNGLLRFDATQNGHLSPLWVGFPAEIPEQRSGRVNPIDAGRYTHASLHLYSSRRIPGGIMWFGCADWDTNPCMGGRPFTIEQGWHTYVFELENTFPGLPQAWTGALPGLRLAVAPDAPSSFALDWLRIHRPAAGTPVTVVAPSGTASSRVLWDLDADAANNTADRSGWGVIGTTSGSGSKTVEFASSAFPPGGYRFLAEHTMSDGRKVVTAHSAPLQIAAPPLPVLDSPDHKGGEDYATAVLRNPWDMSGPEDVAELGNVQNVRWEGGQLHATNGPPNQNDPYVRLRVGAGGIDASRYHRLTVNMSYDGPFGLADAPGGGTHGRLIWWRADTGDWVFHDSREIVNWTDRSIYSVQMRTNPPAAVEDPRSRAPIVGWAGGTVTYLRWDPNEDPGARSWRLDSVELRADHEAKGSFDIRWHDRNPASDGATVSLYVDSDNHGFDGSRIASGLEQLPGPNLHRWDTTSVAPGTYWVWIEVDDGVSVARRYSTGPVVSLGGYRPAGPAPRIDTGDRIDATVRISEERFGDGQAERVVLSRHDVFADSLAGAPLTDEGPLLLSGPNRLPRVVDAELDRVLRPGGTVYLLGGTVGLSDALAAGLRARGYEVRRLSGASRVETAIAVADEVRRLHPASRDVVLARAFGPERNPTAAWADSVTGGGWAAAQGAPVVVTATESVHPALAAALRRWAPSRTILLGGAAALSDAVAAAVPNPVRVSGQERAATAVAIAERLWGGAAARRVLVVPGFAEDGWAFGLAAAGLSADTGAPLVVADALSAPPATVAYVRAATCTGGRPTVRLVGAIGLIGRDAEDALTAPC